jgi:phytoene dehydrogenase-like protein
VNQTRPMKNESFDAIVIGAGMSGMAAAIRLAMFDKKVVLIEKHVISGGLNSYYRRAKRNFDVGLHALTNFARAKEKNKPLKKLLKQLRIPYSDLKLSEQEHSLISFPEHTLKFTNNIAALIQEVTEKFPSQVDGFTQLIAHIEQFNDVSLEATYKSAKSVVRTFITDEKLLEMILCPLLIYGSAWEHDMDFSQFAIMFKAIYLEGFSRPEGGVRTIINLLLNKLKETGADVRFRTGVQSIELDSQGRASAVVTDKGDVLTAPLIISSIGAPETQGLIKAGGNSTSAARVGQMSFVETIAITNKKPQECNQTATIIFYNDSDHYHYEKPDELYDNKSAVICFPNNFIHDDYEEGVLRVTLMANFKKWQELLASNKEQYKEEKEKAFAHSMKLMQKFMPGLSSQHLLYKDTFSPTTVKKYTSHDGGCVYGSPDKTRNGQTNYPGLVICGTDQGFLGIIGSALSGISMANLYGLQGFSQEPTQAASL